VSVVIAEGPVLDVAYVAKLARINLTDEDAKTFQRQLDTVLKYVQKLCQADVTELDAITNAPKYFNVFREDAPSDWFTAKQALSNAPRQVNGLFIVPKVVE
jgi:aspartyl-tRNA(Asn)/glutamyl-tRNA(Gln) amidotransferase subunit C